MVIAIPKKGCLINDNFLSSKSFTIVDIKNNKISDKFDISSEDLQDNYLGLSNMLIGENVSIVIANIIDEKAYNHLTRSGLEVIRGACGNVEEAVSKFLNNELTDIISI